MATRQSLINIPLAVSDRTLHSIVESYKTGAILENKQVEERLLLKDLQNIYPIIPIFGAISSKSIYEYWGTTSYERIKHSAFSASRKSNTIYFYFDTVGGSVAGLAGAMEYLYDLREQGYRLVGIVDGDAASAGCFLLSAMSEIYATATSIVGSIGVRVILHNEAERNKKEGDEYAIISSRENKVLLDKHLPFMEKALSRTQELVNNLDSVLVDTLVKLRPQVTKDTIDTLNGGSVLAKEAINLKLIDGIIPSLESFLISEKEKDEKRKSKLTKPLPIGTTMNIEDINTLDEAKVELAAMQNTITALEQKVEKAEKVENSFDASKVKLEERKRLTEILASAKTLEIPDNIVNKYIESSEPAATIISLFQDMVEIRQAGSSINTGASAGGNSGGNGLEHSKHGSSQDNELSNLSAAIDSLDKIKQEQTVWEIN